MQMRGQHLRFALKDMRLSLQGAGEELELASDLIARQTGADRSPALVCHGASSPRHMQIVQNGVFLHDIPSFPSFGKSELQDCNGIFASAQVHV